MQKVENRLKFVFSVFVVIMLLIWSFSALAAIFFEATTFLFALVFTSSLALLVIASTIIYRVPAVMVAIPESLLLGRFEEEKDETNGCSVPIQRPKTEGLHCKWPWYKMHLRGREIQTLKIEQQRYDIKKGAVLVSGIIQLRRSDFCAYRTLAVPPEDAQKGMSAIADQVLVMTLIDKELEDALALKFGLKEGIEKAFKRSVKVRKPINKEETEIIDDDDTDDHAVSVDDKKKASVKNFIYRILWGKRVSVSDHRFGMEITNVNIDRIDPIPELAEARAGIQVEELEGLRTEKKMIRFKDITEKYKLMYPLLSDEKISQLLKLTEKLATEEKKIFGLADLPEMKELLEKAIPAIKKIVK